MLAWRAVGGIRDIRKELRYCPVESDDSGKIVARALARSKIQLDD
jgi:hypothetical protein